MSMGKEDVAAPKRRHLQQLSRVQTESSTAMRGMSERQYAAHAGVSRGAIQKARAAGRR
ncbi:MAG: hypothetical protein FD152_1046 [Xanthobacteraceae bacterium]|nr:MAG: hypothetical protein FD152_1046 [Xanthobacteraceae bacterium]